MPERFLPGVGSLIGAVLVCGTALLGNAVVLVSETQATPGIESSTTLATAEDTAPLPDSSPPEPGTPEGTLPENTPSDEPPADELPEPLPADPPVANGDGLIAEILAIAGFASLVAIAGWWMIRHRDTDDGPPSPDGDLAGRDLI